MRMAGYGHASLRESRVEKTGDGCPFGAVASSLLVGAAADRLLGESPGGKTAMLGTPPMG
jgi:hypothetical protein